MAGEPRSKLERPENHNLRTRNHRITFRITDDKVNFDYDMFLLPEVYAVDRPGRITVVQTRGGRFIDDFGLGIGTISLSGTTGWGQARNNSPYFNGEQVMPLNFADGFDRWKGLVNFFQTWFQWRESDADNKWRMHFLNWSEKDHFRVYPTGLPKLTRSTREALLFRYDIQLTLLSQLAKTDYRHGDADTDHLADLGVRNDRLVAISLRMEDQLANQAALVGHILNSQEIGDFDPENPLDNLFGELDAESQDFYTQQFIDNLIRTQAPATYVVPTDSGSGTVSRTRGIVNKIKDFTDGKTAKIDTTLGEVQAAVNGWRDVLDAAEYAVNLPVVYAREVKETLCSVQGLLLYPQLFRNSVSAALTELSTLLLDSGCATTLRR